ncbi:MAG TPA: HNH endonuclease domain-containing protein [Puia sp.]|nr:HNH endonuclease domain-containing protein [Puia sp.]
MPLILGLDLGTNSIGWALIDSSSNIIDCGVRIFPEGVNRDSLGKEESKNATRRSKRQTRRQLFRRKYRKLLLAKYLMEKEMFPKISDLSHTIVKLDQPGELRSFFNINPYACRSNAYKGEKLSLIELGRVLYHFAQRRGYKESIKDDAADTGALYEGVAKDGKTGINETWDKINQFGTLGNYLFHEDSHQKRLRNRYTTRKMYTEEFEKIWEKQKTFYPDILTDEMKQKVGDATEGFLFFQRPLKPQKFLIADCTFEPGKKRASDSTIAFELRRIYEFINSIRIDGSPLLEHQRATVKELMSTKDKLVFGKIAEKLKVPITRFNYEEDKNIVGSKSIFSLRKIFTPKVWDAMTLEEQENVLGIKRFAEDKAKTIEYLKKKFSVTDKQADQFLKFRPSKSYSSLSYKATMNILPFLEKGYIYNEAVLLGGIYNAFGREKWDSLGEQVQDYIETNAIEIYHNTGAEHITIIRGWLSEEYGLTEKMLTKLYHHSQVVIRGDGQAALLPMPEDTRNPVVQQSLYELRNLVNAIIKKYGKPDEVRMELSRELKSSIEERNKMRLNQYENEKENDLIKAELSNNDLPHTNPYIIKLKLYREVLKRAGKAACPYSGDPIAFHQLWNGEVDVEHIIPYSISLDDSLANKTLCFRKFNMLKGNRTPYQFFNFDHGNEAWEEAKKRAYSLLPYLKWLRFIDEKPHTLEEFENRKLNDSRYISKVAKGYMEFICSKVNVTQGEVTAKLRHYWGLDGILNPSIRVDGITEGEYYAAVDENRKIIQLEKWLSDSKANKKTEEKLAKVGLVISGNIKKNTFFPYKSRNDHRHHVIDAITIACTTRSYLQNLSTMKGKMPREEYEKRELSFPEPWPSFHRDVESAVHRVLVSHKSKSRVITRSSKTITKADKKIKVSGLSIRGALHGESVYGNRKDIYGKEAYHIRKPLMLITKRAQVDKIVDPQVKKLVEQAIIKRWQELDSEIFKNYQKEGLIYLKGSSWEINKENKTKYDVPDGAFFRQEKDETGKKIIGIYPKVFLPNRNGEPVAIRKVRIKENSSGAVKLKEEINQWVEPGNNFGVMIYQDPEGNYKEKIISFWEAVERKKQENLIFQPPADGKRLITTLQINDIFIIGLQEDEINWKDQALLCEHLYRVQKLSSYYYTFRKSNAATLDFAPEEIRIQSFKSWQEKNPIKVKINILGEIKPLK